MLILDINLPDGNGIDFLQYIKSTSHTAVVLLTANDLETDIVTGLESGADDYITKPFSLMVLWARVNAQLRKIKPNHKILIDNFYFNFKTMDFRKSERQIELSNAVKYTNENEKIKVAVAAYELFYRDMVIKCNCPLAIQNIINML